MSSTNLRSVALSLLLIAVAANSSAAGTRWLTSVDDARAAARDGDRYILVDLYADWCGWCKVLEKEVFASPQFQQVSADMVLLRVDVMDGGEGTELQARFGANSLPTTLVLDADLVKVGEVRGYAPTAQFIAALRGQLGEYATMLDLFERMRRAGDTAMTRQLAEDFHARGDGARAAVLYDALLETVGHGEAAAWLLYLAADAHRLSGALARAEARLDRAHQLAAAVDDQILNERLDMLRYYLAHANGDCPAAVASLETFLERHPRSDLRAQASNTLAALRRGEGMECT